MVVFGIEYLRMSNNNDTENLLYVEDHVTFLVCCNICIGNKKKYMKLSILLQKQNKHAKNSDITKFVGTKIGSNRM